MFNRFKNVVVVIALCLIAGVAYSTEILVDSGAVDNSINGNCSLVEAIRAANTDAAVDDCPAGAGEDTLTLQSGIYELGAVVDGRFGSNGTPCIESKINIQGNGATITRQSAVTLRLICVANSGELTLSDMTLENGLASGSSIIFRRGGGVMSRGKLTLSGVTFHNNDADAQGGGVFIDGGIAVVTDSLFTSNNADKGGAFRTDADAVVTISGSEFTGNTANFGGAVFLNNTTSTISGSTFRQNDASNMGGGVYFSGSNVTLKDSFVIGNTTVEKGGGVRIDNGSAVTINRVVIDQNDATDYGGGIYLILSDLTLINSTISNNTSERGGGFYIDVATTIVENSTFSANSAQIYGGAMYLDADTSLSTVNAIASINSTTVYDNNADAAAGGIWVNPKSRATLFNTVVAKNTNRNCAGPGTMDPRQGNWVDDQYCLTDIGGDPKLGELQNNGGSMQTHKILFGSPLIGAGYGPKCPLSDQLGRARNGGVCDIGALEYVDLKKVSMAPIYDLLLEQAPD